jgi:hypothetical protein
LRVAERNHNYVNGTTLTVKASTPQSGAPTGSVTFYDHGAALGTATIATNGVAT